MLDSAGVEHYLTTHSRPSLRTPQVPYLITQSINEMDSPEEKQPAACSAGCCGGTASISEDIQVNEATADDSLSKCCVESNLPLHDVDMVRKDAHCCRETVKDPYSADSKEQRNVLEDTCHGNCCSTERDKCCGLSTRSSPRIAPAQQTERVENACQDMGCSERQVDVEDECKDECCALDPDVNTTTENASEAGCHLGVQADSQRECEGICCSNEKASVKDGCRESRQAEQRSASEDSLRAPPCCKGKDKPCCDGKAHPQTWLIDL